MIQKISKILICTVAVLCLFCSSVTVFAENGDLDFDFNIQPVEPTTQEEILPSESETETEKQTEKETKKETEKETTEKPTKKPTKPYTTEPDDEPVYNNNNNNGNNVNQNVQANDDTTKKETTTEGTTDEPLPEGSFYVYLERNNGQRRLKTVMSGKGYVPEPEIPVRQGYVFAGWYSDANFKNKWDFLKDQTDKTITIYAKWKADEGTVVYDIIIEDAVGGKLEVNPQKASLGEPVVITVTPDEGKRLVQGSILINGEPTDFLSFIMPKGKVTISASFEDIPESDGEEEKPKLPLFIGIGAVVAVILVAIIIVAKRRRDFNADLDPDEDIYAVEDNDDDNWIDESIVVEDGFKEGKKVVENTEPDYGAPEADLDE